MSADARVARAILDVRRELAQHLTPETLKAAVERLIDEAAAAVYLCDDDIDQYR